MPRPTRRQPEEQAHPRPHRGAVRPRGRRGDARRPPGSGKPAAGRTADRAQEVELATYPHFAARDRLSDVMFERMLAGVKTRRYVRTGEPVGEQIDEIARSTSKSAVSRESCRPRGTA